MAKLIEFEYKLRGRGNKDKTRKLSRWGEFTGADDALDTLFNVVFKDDKDKANGALVKALTDYFEWFSVHQSGIDFDVVAMKLAKNLIRLHKDMGVDLSEDAALAKAKEMLPKRS